jgi:ribosomal protein L37AE/L43A
MILLPHRDTSMQSREVAMPTIGSKRRSSFGMGYVQCDNELIAPESSEFRDERHILHLWRCPKCDTYFEVISPADTKSIKDVMARIEDIVTWGDIPASRSVA